MDWLKRGIISHVIALIIAGGAWLIIPLIFEVEPRIRNIAVIGIAVVVEFVVSRMLKKKSDTHEE
jgi:putative flippase GtrA